MHDTAGWRRAASPSSCCCNCAWSCGAAGAAFPCVILAMCPASARADALSSPLLAVRLSHTSPHRNTHNSNVCVACLHRFGGGISHPLSFMAHAFHINSSQFVIQAEVSAPGVRSSATGMHCNSACTHCVNQRHALPAKLYRSGHSVWGYLSHPHTRSLLQNAVSVQFSRTPMGFGNRTGSLPTRCS